MADFLADRSHSVSIEFRRGIVRRELMLCVTLACWRTEPKETGARKVRRVELKKVLQEYINAVMDR